MFGFEFNKVAAAILVSGVAAMVVGLVTDGLYHPETKIPTRGFEIAVTNSQSTDGAPVEEKIDIAQMMAKADIEKGQASSGKCAVCHNMVKGAGAKVGPDLWAVLERPKASIADYTYSSAMSAKGGKWDYEDLYHFLKSPKKFVPGTKMGFAGFNKPEDVINMIAYLRTLDDKPVSLPTDAK